MNHRIQPPIWTAIYIPLLKHISGDRSANGYVQFASLHPEISLNDLRPINAGMHHQHQFQLAIPFFVRAFHLMGLYFCIMYRVCSLDTGNHQVPKFVALPIKDPCVPT